jgi:hypothetical protein
MNNHLKIKVINPLTRLTPGPQQRGGSNFDNYININITKKYNKIITGGYRRFIKSFYIKHGAKETKNMKSFSLIKIQIKKLVEFNKIKEINIYSNYNNNYVTILPPIKKDWKIMEKNNNYKFTLEDIGQKYIYFDITLSGPGNVDQRFTKKIKS